MYNAGTEIKMVERKDISEMSFEEFFSRSGDDADSKKSSPSSTTGSSPEHDATMGFGGSAPKINYRDGKFLLYIPRFKGSGKFDVAIETKSEVIPVARLDSTKLREHRLTRPATVGLDELGVCPLDEFILTIDGANVFVNKSRKILLFNSSGLPVSHASGETTVVFRKGTPLRMFKASLLKTDTVGDVTVSIIDVAPGGFVRIQTEEPSEQAAPESKPEAPKKATEAAAPASKKAAPAAKKTKKTPVKAALSLSAGIPEASASIAGSIVPIFKEPPTASISVDGCDISECTVSVVDSSGEIVFGRVPAEARMDLRNGRSEGLLTANVEKEGKVLKSAQYFLIPDFACEYSGKGDIPDDTSVRFTMFGQGYEKGIYDDDFEGPYSHGDSSFGMLWSVPVVTYDLGEGPRPYEQLVLSADELTSSMLVVKVRGAKKKKIYFGPEGGKKEDITKGWDSDSVQINLPPLLDQVYSSTGTYCFFISINSFPNRKFIQIHNPERAKVSVADGSIGVEVLGGKTDCDCVIFLQDKTSKTVRLAEGSNAVPIPADAVEAEIVESFKGKVRRVTPVKVRPLPFISSIAGDLWLYVSKDKRIPLPDGLFKGDAPDLDAVTRWHGKIVGMNPELKAVSLAEMKRAFTDFKG